MPGGLVQLTGFGAQNVFLNGNPSMTYFTKMYKRHTNFAMEHFQLPPMNVTDTNLPIAGNKTFRFKVPRYADLLHDCYLCVDIPDIWSPLVEIDKITHLAKEFQFQWIRNLGYNMIQQATVTLNGTPVVTMTGEWMKIASYLKHDATKRAILDKMVGNTPDMYDPANSPGLFNQYPNAINVDGVNAPAPSIRGRQLNIPLPFWFCEEIGQSLPLVSLVQTEVEIQITFNNIYNLFTMINLNYNQPYDPTYLTRIVGNPADTFRGIQNFLSYPDIQGNPTNTALQNWNFNPYIEANYIFLTDTERAHVAAYEKSFLVTQVRYMKNNNQYGYNDVPIPMYNLCTRIVSLFQRQDRILVNDWDNYTNWDNIYYAPVNPSVLPSNVFSPVPPSQFYSSGIQLSNNMNNQDIMQEGTVVLDGTQRENTKNTNFFRLIQNYKFSKGDTTSLPGINLYSFSLDPNTITQPSGTLNGSMFNRTNLQYTLLVPPTITTIYDSSGQLVQVTSPAAVCIVKETAFNPVPTLVPIGATVSPGPGIPPLLQAGQTLTIIPPSTQYPLQYGAYSSMIYIESYNFLKVTNGQGNLVFST
jgi:hypothetical protein